MAKYAAALDQGTTSTRCMIFDHAGRVVSVAQKEHEQIYPKPGWVEHDPMEIWERSQEVMARGARLRRSDRGRHRRPGHHQPARDHGRVGSHHRRAGAQRDRVAGHAHGSPRRRVLARRRPGPLPRADRPAAGDLLLGSQGALDARQRRRPGRSRGVRRSAVRQHRHLVHLEPHRRQGRRRARHRRVERQPHAADGPQHARLGRRDRLDDRRPDGDAAGDQGLQRGLRRGALGRPVRRRARSPATWATSRRRRSGRRASRPARPRTPTAPATSSCSTRARRRCSPSRA